MNEPAACSSAVDGGAPSVAQRLLCASHPALLCRAQVKKKMTSDEFVRNNRGINNGDNLPPDFLRSIYTSISRNEIRITSEAAAVPFDVSPLIWAELQRAAYTPRGAMVEAPIDGAPPLRAATHCPSR
jgi:hypothetical protein